MLVSENELYYVKLHKYCSITQLLRFLVIKIFSVTVLPPVKEWARHKNFRHPLIKSYTSLTHNMIRFCSLKISRVVPLVQVSLKPRQGLAMRYHGKEARPCRPIEFQDALEYSVNTFRETTVILN